MGYLDNKLLQNEKIIGVGNINIFYYFINIFATFIGITLISSNYGLLVLIGFIFIICGIYEIIQLYNTEILATNKRVIYKTGTISRHIFELQIKQIESIRIQQTIFMRIIGAGLLKIYGTGGDYRTIKYISNFEQFKQIIYNIVEGNPSIDFLNNEVYNKKSDSNSKETKGVIDKKTQDQINEYLKKLDKM